MALVTEAEDELDHGGADVATIEALPDVGVTELTESGVLQAAAARSTKAARAAARMLRRSKFGIPLAGC